MEKHNQSLKDHTAEALRESDFDERTLILAVNEESQRKIFENYENAQNVFLLSNYVSSTEGSKIPMAVPWKIMEPAMMFWKA